MLCEYGCGKESQYQLKNKKRCCEKHPSSCLNIRNKNSIGLKNCYINGTKNRNNFTVEQRIKSNVKQIQVAKDIAFGPNVKRFKHKDYLIELRGYECEICNLQDWLSQPITLEVDHIDGNNTNNNLGNLRLLCPNCHSQTDTWRGRNVNTGKRKFPEDYMLALYKEHGTIHKTLIAAGMAPKGGNYSTMKKLLLKHIDKI